MTKSISLLLVISFCILALVACFDENYYDYSYPEYISDESGTESDFESVTSELHADSNEETRSDDLETTETTEFTESSEMLDADTQTESLNESDEGKDTEIETGSETETAPIHVDIDENNHCDICGVQIKIENGTTSGDGSSLSVALFDKLGDKNFDTTGKGHTEGGEMNTNTDTYKSGDYELKFQNYTKVYKNSCDAKGNVALKIGNGTSIGTFEFTVPEDIQIVIIKVAKYKTVDSTVIINNRAYVLKSNSDDGEYDEIIIDTSKTKTIVFSTTIDHKRCMLRSIEFVN